jgi:hypothetical protein
MVQQKRAFTERALIVYSPQSEAFSVPYKRKRGPFVRTHRDVCKCTDDCELEAAVFST